MLQTVGKYNIEITIIYIFSNDDHINYTYRYVKEKIPLQYGSKIVEDNLR